MSVPKCLFFQDLEGLTEGFGGMSAGMSGRKLPLWAEFSFLINGPFPTFRKKFQKNSGKTPETLSEFFLEFPSRVRLGSPKPYTSRHLRLPEFFFSRILSPQYGWGLLFFQKWFRRGPLRAGNGIPSSTERFAAAGGRPLRTRTSLI